VVAAVHLFVGLTVAS
jgi:hypothetical protein